MTLDLAKMMIVIGAISSLIALATTIWNIFSSRPKQNAAAISGLDARISRLEQTVISLPGRDQLHELQINLVQMGGELREMRAMMEGTSKLMARLETVVVRHEEHMLESAR